MYTECTNEIIIMNHRGKEALGKISKVRQTLTLWLCFSVLPVEPAQIIHSILTDPESDCKDTNSTTYKHNHFCPNLIFKMKYDDDIIMENPIQELALVHLFSPNDEQTVLHKYNLELTNKRLLGDANGDTNCRFLDSNIVLLAAAITSCPWNFTSTKQCRHVSNKFPENHYLPCTLHGESNISLSLNVSKEDFTVLYNEKQRKLCTKKPKFLVAIFRKRKGMACLLKVQQYSIDANMTKMDCDHYETTTTCGLYPCSEENRVLSRLQLIIDQESSSNIHAGDTMKPQVSFQFQKQTKPFRETMRKKTTFRDYFVELLVAVAIVVLVVLLCIYTKCCTLLKADTSSSSSVLRQRQSHAPYLGYTSCTTETGYTNHLPIPDYGLGLSKCSKKPSCVCGTQEQSSRIKKWGHRGDGNDAYVPVQQEDSHTYIPSVARV